VFPYKTSFHLDRKNKQALYLQLANQFITLIKNAILPPKTKLLGSRSLAVLLQVHRKTIVACYEELALQGWVESVPKKGTFVHADLPLFYQQKRKPVKAVDITSKAGFQFYSDANLKSNQRNSNPKFQFLNDGISDGRLAPINELARIYRGISQKKNAIAHLSYGSVYGNLELRKTLVSYLNETRGLNITIDNILITRGSQMGIFLSSKTLCKENDSVVVGETNYSAADATFIHQKATLLRVSVDEDGINTHQIEKICKHQQIKAVYVTSHHHHPTTVTLSAERRIHLLNLAKEYRFAVIEDDYDYDFNYNHAPILPLASHDTNGNVIYIGSVCKTVAPVFRIGYLIAPKEFVGEVANLRRIIDRQGDALLELTFSNFIKNGDLDRHIRKVMKIYKSRRDLFCQLLQEELPTFFQFEIPKGGMAVWVTLDKKYTWENVEKIGKKHYLEIGDWKRYDAANTKHNAIRIGFASYTEAEIYTLIQTFKTIMNELLLAEKPF